VIEATAKGFGPYMSLSFAHIMSIHFTKALISSRFNPQARDSNSLTYPSIYADISQLLWLNPCRSLVMEINEVFTIGISRLVRKSDVHSLWLVSESDISCFGGGGVSEIGRYCLRYSN
jgi:hypothetical protein